MSPKSLTVLFVPWGRAISTFESVFESWQNIQYFFYNHFFVYCKWLSGESWVGIFPLHLRSQNKKRSKLKVDRRRYAWGHVSPQSACHSEPFSFCQCDECIKVGMCRSIKCCQARAFNMPWIQLNLITKIKQCHALLLLLLPFCSIIQSKFMTRASHQEF